jgi:hypothetical protein
MATHFWILRVLCPTPRTSRKPRVARRLVAWCGLEWEPGCLRFHEGKRPVRTASVRQVRQPIYQRSVARWKHYEKPLGPLFDRLEVNQCITPSNLAKT